jgi:hypothetical protein
VIIPSPPFPSPVESDGLVAVRDWLMAGGDPVAREEDTGTPLWALAMERGWVGGVDELLAAGADPNQRSVDGAGWLHWAIRTRMPHWLVAQGFRRLGRGWWYPDEAGFSPFQEPALSPALSTMMDARWWAEGHTRAVPGR